jgi:hypothetical protein
MARFTRVVVRCMATPTATFKERQSKSGALSLVSLSADS